MCTYVTISSIASKVSSTNISLTRYSNELPLVDVNFLMALHLEPLNSNAYVRSGGRLHQHGIFHGISS